MFLHDTPASWRPVLYQWPNAWDLTLTDNVAATGQEQADCRNHGETRRMAEQERGAALLHDSKEHRGATEAWRGPGHHLRGAVPTHGHCNYCFHEAKSNLTLTEFFFLLSEH